MSVPFLSFLYPARALQRLPRAPITQHFLRSVHVPASPKKPRPAGPDPIPFDLPPELKADLQPEAEPDEPQSTMTPSERNAFDRIFEEIAARHQLELFDTETENATKPLPERALQTEDAEIEDESTPALPLTYRHTDFNPVGRSKVNRILGRAKDGSVLAKLRQDIKHRRKPSALNPAATNNVSEQLEALQRYPLSLRGAARLAMGITEPEQEEHEAAVVRVGVDRGNAEAGDAQSLGTSRTGQVHALSMKVDSGLLDRGPGRAVPPDVDLAVQTRTRLQVKTETEMKSRKSDFELWDYMQKHVFSLVRRLGIAESHSARRSSKKAPELSMDVYGPLYPSLLLHGLRLLDGNFGRPSPLALSLLPRIKELGLASYVLGVSTPFYNTLMGIYWYRHCDVNAVLGLLDEMQRAGLQFDEVSLSILNSIKLHLVPYTLGKSGPFLEEVMKMPEFDSVHTKTAYWRKQIERNIHGVDSRGL